MNQMNHKQKQKQKRRRNQNRDRITKAALAMTAAFSAGALIWICRTQIARPSVRYGILAAAAGIFSCGVALVAFPAQAGIVICRYSLPGAGRYDGGTKP